MRLLPLAAVCRYDGLVSENRRCAHAACSTEKQRFLLRSQRNAKPATCVKDRERDRPDASCLFFLWSAVEDLVLEAWLDVVVKSNPAHISLHLDGVRISENAISGDVSDFCKECELHIQRKTGYQVRIRPKYHSDMLGGVHTHAFERESLQDDVKELKQHGNKLPAIHLQLSTCRTRPPC